MERDIKRELYNRLVEMDIISYGDTIQLWHENGTIENLNMLEDMETSFLEAWEHIERTVPHSQIHDLVMRIYDFLNKALFARSNRE